MRQSTDIRQPLPSCLLNQFYKIYTMLITVGAGQKIDEKKQFSKVPGSASLHQFGILVFG